MVVGRGSGKRERKEKNEGGEGGIWRRGRALVGREWVLEKSKSPSSYADSAMDWNRACHR